MSSKSKNNKTRNTKNNISATPLPAKDVANILDVSESTVKKVRTGLRTEKTLVGQKVKLFDEIYAQESSFLIKEIIRIVKI